MSAAAGLTRVGLTRLPGRAQTALALLGAGTVLLLIAAAIPLSVLSRSNPVSTAGTAAVIGLPCAAVGFVVAYRKPRNPLGWFMLALGVCILLSADAGLYAVADYRLHHGQLPFGWVAVLLQPLWAPALLSYPLVILLFPDGRLPSRRWRWAIWIYLVAAAILPLGLLARTLSVIVTGRIQVLRNGDQAAVDHPTGSPGWALVLLSIALPLLVVFWLAFLGRQAASFRRSTGERRQQLKWLMSAAAVFLLAVTASAVVSVLYPHPPRIAAVIISGLGFGIAALPVGIGVGILKYRLYDIDRFISRTLAYAIVTGLLIGVYAGLVTLASLVLTSRSPVTVAIATLAAAALFNPVRRRVQRIVDHRFNRARYNAERTVAAFTARLQDAVDLDEVRHDLLAAVQGSLEPAHASIWLAGAGT